MKKTPGPVRGTLTAELLRKGLHMLIALVPSLADVNRSHTALLLMGGVFIYAVAESMRCAGVFTPLISLVTKAAARSREQGNFVLGPVTLGLGALLSLLLFPPKTAALAVYVLAFGDSAPSLAGKFLGRIRPAFMSGKSVEGSLACFAATAAASFLLFRDWKIAAAVGLVSTVADVLPLKDFDNIVMPLAAGFCAGAFQWLKQ